MTLSKVVETDDFSQIIRLIYNTDDYIYPLMCGNDYSYFEKMMLHHLNTDSFFSYKNIVVAKKNDDVLGIVLAFDIEQAYLPVLKNSEIEIRECYSAVMNNYFQKLVSAVSSDCLYINNVCVDAKWRGLGAGYALMQSVIKNSIKNKIVLDCLADNLPALALYKKCGFEVIDSYPGFSGDDNKKVQCLKLEMNKNSNI